MGKHYGMSPQAMAARTIKYQESVARRREQCKRVAARYFTRAGQAPLMDAQELEAVQRRRAGISVFRQLLEERWLKS